MQTYFDASTGSATMNSATAALLLLCIITLAIIVIRHRSGKKKYDDPDYLEHLAPIQTFNEEVNSFASTGSATTALLLVLMGNEGMGELDKIKIDH